METGEGREALVEALHGLFRRGGFDGVSIADITKATGLGRSSLYHHFPGGKADMARAVLERARAGAEAQLFAPLRSGTRAARIDGHLAAVDALYGGGERPCLVASMLVGLDGNVTPGVSALVRGWVDTLATALAETGAAAPAARTAAVDTVARIQGALIVVRSLGDTAVFRAVLAAARRDLLAL